MAGSVLSLSSGAVVHGPAVVQRAPALFLHGVGGAAWSWGPQRDALPDAAFVWEARGHGEAKPVADAGLADWYADAREALEAVHATAGRKVFLVGHSMGGLLAMALAAQRPEAVAGVMLIDPVYAESGALPVPIPRFVLWPLRLFVSAVARSFQVDGWLGRALARPIFRWAFHDPAVRERAWEKQRKQVPLEHPRMLLESVDGVRGFPFAPFADQLDVPVAFLEASSRTGARSRFTRLKERLRARLGPRATFVSVVGGHYLQLDRPAEVNVALNELLRAAV
jgi:pimeloyl-ACP methyl ester carboxylesterase